MEFVKLNKKNKRVSHAAQYAARIAVMAALLTALKFALSFIPNVEVVTLLILAYSAVFGAAYAIPAALVFCAVELAVYGPGSWALLYFIYWPLLALIACAVLRRRKLWAAILLAVIMSVFFGALSACADTLIAAANLTAEELPVYFTAYYLRGLYFDTIHVVSNAIVVGAAFVPLTRVLKRFVVNRAETPVINARDISLPTDVSGR